SLWWVHLYFNVVWGKEGYWRYWSGEEELDWSWKPRSFVDEPIADGVSNRALRTSGLIPSSTRRSGSRASRVSPTAFGSASRASVTTRRVLSTGCFPTSRPSTSRTPRV